MCTSMIVILAKPGELMGRSLQVQIVNYLSILSLESNMAAQNNWFMHTIKVFVLQKFTVVVF